MILDNGLKIMSIDATDLFRVEVESTKNKKGKEIKVAKEIVPSGLSSYYDYYDESKDEILHLRNPQLFKMKLDSSMALDELGRVIADRRMTKTAFFNVRRKLATDQVVYLTFKYSSFRSTLEDDKDDKGKVKKYRVDGKTKETIRYMIYDKRDSSTIYVSDKDGVQVAEFKSNKVKPYEFADIIDAMGRWYNKGLLVVEKASGGHSCIERLRYDKKYMNMYKYKCYDEFKRTIWKVGFDTNNKTKSIAVNDMREWFDKGLIDIQSNDLLEEMKTFVAEDNGAFNAVVGSHDDLVSACWLCIAGMKSAFWYPF